MLPAGTRLGPYEVAAPLGAGGMGEVYRARDTRLGREVAIKVVHGAVPATPEARQRFEREARTVSSLNHPHICTLHDIGREGDIDYLVMELIEGESLAQRLAKGALPASEALRLGIQVADALHRAHGAGVIHRDLKPGNVMLAKSGAKLMDFGLARFQPSGAVAVGSVSPTREAQDQRPLTAEGAILGTIQYLSPEQLEGREADARSDVWALGCVLYEMTTGTPAFAGKSQASLVGAIMNLEPEPIARRAPLSPPALDRLVRACLAKDPEERIQTAHDVRLGLEWIRDGGSQAGIPAPLAARRRSRERLAWALAAAGVLAAMALTFVRADRPGLTMPVRFAFSPSTNWGLTEWACALAASPDGSQLAYIANSGGGNVVWLRSMSWEFPKSLQQTGGAYQQIFWSPDGRDIGFFAQRGGKQYLLKAPLDGGNATTLCEVTSPRGGCWNRHGDILVAPAAQGPIFRTHAGGGELRPVTRLDAGRGETSHRFPCFLPDGDHFLFAAMPAEPGGYTIYVGSLRTGRTRRLMHAESVPVYAEPGALLFLRKGQVAAQRFDARRLALRGEPVTIAGAPPLSDLDAEPVVTASRAGSLFILRNDRRARHVVWADPHGLLRDTLDLPMGSWQVLRLSPDGRRVCVYNDGYWILDLDRLIPTRLASSASEHDFSMAWSPDGRRVAYTAMVSGRMEILLANADGSGTPAVLPTTASQFKAVWDWSPDGRHLVFGTLEAATDWDVWAIALEGERKPQLCRAGPGYDGDARFSPDGRWLALTSSEFGVRAAFLQSFPGDESRVRVSTGVGLLPRWVEGGRALVFRAGRNELRATIGPGNPPVPGPPRTLFPLIGDFTRAEFAPDGRLLASFPMAGPASDVKVVLNWPALLEH